MPCTASAQRTSWSDPARDASMTDHHDDLTPRQRRCHHQVAAAKAASAAAHSRLALLVAATADNALPALADLAKIVTMAYLARTLGVSRETVRRWRAGKGQSQSHAGVSRHRRCDWPTLRHWAPISSP